MDKYRNKYRIPTARAAFWDYSNNGTYFITICTANRECLFGDIVNGSMALSPIGEIVIREWDKSFEIRSELFCDAFVLMPNHLHAILRIENVETHGRASVQGRAYGNPVFTIILFAMMQNTNEYSITSKPIPKIGNMINFSNQRIRILL